MKKYQSTLSLILYTIIHMAVDLSCLFYITAQVRSVCYVQEDIIGLAILYNFCAFGLPMLMGLISDYVEKNDWLASLGCVLIALIYVCNVGASTALSQRAQANMLIPPVLACIIIGIGNGLFHIGSGRQVLQDAAGKYSKPGIFISAGALGVFLGKTYASPYNTSLYFVMLAVLLVFAAYLFALGAFRKKAAGKLGTDAADTLNANEVGNGAALAANAAVELTANAPGKLNANNGVEFAATAAMKQIHFAKNQFSKTDYKALPSWGVLSLFIIVIIRSFYGCVLSYSWNNTLLIGFIFTACVFAGKFLGGIVADHFGVTLASVISLGGAGLTVLFSANSIFLGCLGILLFNMTMPLTLTLLAEYWKKFPGFAFGTLMMALFLGTLPTMAFGVAKITSLFYAFAFCILSMVILVNAIYLRKKQ